MGYADSAVRILAAFALFLLLPAPLASAQTRNEFGSWIGVSAGAPTLVGKSQHASFAFLAVRYSRTLLVRSEVELRYTVEGVPIASLSYLNEDGKRENVRGPGASPAGLEMGFRAGTRFEPSIAVSGGFIRFERNVPHLGRRLNFTGDVGASARIRLSSSLGLRLAYKYHHLSNAYRAPSNPGFDSNLLIFGLSLKR
jgi:hypothetical protein